MYFHNTGILHLLFFVQRCQKSALEFCHSKKESLDTVSRIEHDHIFLKEDSESTNFVLCSYDPKEDECICDIPN